MKRGACECDNLPSLPSGNDDDALTRQAAEFSMGWSPVRRDRIFRPWNLILNLCRSARSLKSCFWSS
ncbi:hypothetical protein SZ54_0558 [Rhizobium sp. UR51a]|nr:hypothetical protein SZ54_0558 [Rhizobium sp. UR51a]